MSQIIPLPEAADLEPKWREQEQEKKRASHASNPILGAFWASLIECASGKTELLTAHKGSSSSSLYIPIEVPGVRYRLRLAENQVRVLLVLDFKTNGEKKRQWVENLMPRKQEMESIFGGSLDWIYLTSKYERRLRHSIPTKGYPQEAEWPNLQNQIIDALIRLDIMLCKPIQYLKI